MRLEQLAYFKKLAEVGTITLASQQLYISQQALSTAIKKLEDELHTQLFVRTSRGVVLTADGEYLLEEATNILDKIEEVTLHFLGQGKQKVALKIGAIPMILRHILPKGISYFYKNLPNVQLEISEMHSKEIVEQVQRSALDLGFLSTLTIEGKEDFSPPNNTVFTPILHLPFSIVVSKDHPLNKYAALSFEQLADYPALLLMFEENIMDYLPYRILQSYGMESIIHVDNEVLYNQMLEDGLGYSLYTQISETPPYQLGKSLAVHPLKDKLFSSIGYIQNNNATSKLPYIQLFCKHI